VFLFGYDTSIIGLYRVMVRFADLCILATGFVFWFLPETKISGLFEQPTVMTNERASNATREGQGTS
jgi:hypothetical protein